VIEPVTSSAVIAQPDYICFSANCSSRTCPSLSAYIIEHFRNHCHDLGSTESEEVVTHICMHFPFTSTPDGHSCLCCIVTDNIPL
jgi:hypothetical protein